MRGDTGGTHPVVDLALTHGIAVELILTESLQMWPRIGPCRLQQRRILKRDHWCLSCHPHVAAALNDPVQAPSRTQTTRCNDPPRLVNGRPRKAELETLCAPPLTSRRSAARKRMTTLARYTTRLAIP